MGPNSDLVSFHSDHEQAFVTTILASHDRPDIEIYEFWIGFHDFVHWDYGDYGTFVWSDQSIVNYVNWAANEPNGVNEVEGICVEMWAHDDYDIGHWNDHYCETQLPYICKSKASMDNPEPPTVEKCSDQYSDFDKFKSGCYKWVDEPATWSEAEAKCQKMDGSHLVSILSQSEEAFALISMKSQASWTGLTDQNHLGYFKWSDGWPMQISNWGQYPSNSAQESLCVSFNATDGKWYPQSCQEKLPFLCKHSDATPPTPSPNGECPTSAFTDLDPSLEHCYHFEHDLTLAWGEANRACLAMGHGSNLVSIHSEHEMNLIAGELGKYQVVAWIGLFTTAEAGNTFFWVDNSPTDFFNWEDNEPNGQGYELCVQVYGHNGKWNDATCTPYDQNLGYVCKAPKIQIPTEIPPKSSSTTNEIPSSSSSSSPSSVSSTTQTSTRSTETTTTILIEPPDGNIL